MTTALIDNNKPPVNAVIKAVAEATDSDPLDLPPLREAINPDALNTLFDRSETSSQVRFQYAGFEVIVQDEIVEVEPLQEAFYSR
ncbi:HalOD1 output domain-containing protein [Natrinema salinisoli]|uniref:HalOD1 output domain-containing protein n=1 Tax=Natrinema salinisoli TaxID=2878535 RepID=UPI001CF08A4B|nr:HalOD1 output domain-containing protein [Natrinema salinisoli]